MFKTNFILKSGIVRENILGLETFSCYSNKNLNNWILSNNYGPVQLVHTELQKNTEKNVMLIKTFFGFSVTHLNDEKFNRVLTLINKYVKDLFIQKHFKQV